VAPLGTYRIDIFMYWYHPDSVVTGTAVHRPDYIKHLWSGATFNDPTCSYHFV
jgi:hypothetical protein